MMPGRGGESPSYDELAAVVVGLTARLDELSVRVGVLEADNARLVVENTALRQENAVLRAENTDLRRRLGLNSTNSSKPPSSDGLAKHEGVEPGHIVRAGQRGHGLVAGAGRGLAGGSLPAGVRGLR